jgi:hypothetical protein
MLFLQDRLSIHLLRKKLLYKKKSGVRTASLQKEMRRKTLRMMNNEQERQQRFSLGWLLLGALTDMLLFSDRITGSIN